VLKGIARWIGSDMAVTNVNAVLRIPGTFNLKVEGEPFPIKRLYPQNPSAPLSIEDWKGRIPGYVQPVEYVRQERMAPVGGYLMTKAAQDLFDNPPAENRHKALSTIMAAMVYYQRSLADLESVAAEFARRTGLPDSEAQRLAVHFDTRRN
jgi:hypothetical protein